MILSPQDVAEFFQEAKLRAPRRLRRIASGIESSIFSLVSGHEPLILTLFHDVVEKRDMLLLKESSDRFIKAGFPLARILHHGPIQGKFAILTSFLEGKVIHNWEPNEYEKVGFLLGNMHKFSESLPCSTSEKPFIFDQFTKFYELAPSIPKEFFVLEKELENAMKGWPSHLQKGMIHGDLWYKNILFEGGDPSGILDFTEAHYDLLILDLGSLIKWIFFSPNSEYPEAKLEWLLSEYSIARPLILEEIEYLPLMVTTKIISTILFHLKQSQRKNEYLSYAYLNLLKLEESKNLSLFETISNASSHP